MISQNEARRWFFSYGYEELNENQQLEYLIRYCGYIMIEALSIVQIDNDLFAEVL